MQIQTFETSTMYGDHHVTEVRRILLELPGVKDVYASSSFHIIEVTFDSEKINAEKIRSRIEAEGYMGELPMLSEPEEAVYNNREGGNTFFRHTNTNKTVKNILGFSQPVNHQGRPLWPCPGMGVIKKDAEES
ncbi:MAG: heavy-metal-associated domain-containing protein [Anaerolineales bacterium]|nr:heavy-metal-associated domain-containing protein [Anaerolineales bacterium]